MLDRNTGSVGGWLQNTPTASLQKSKNPLHECPVYDTKQFDGKVSVMLELWEMQSNPTLASLPGPLWPRVVAPNRILTIGQIELFHILTE